MRHGFEDKRAMIKTTLMSSCHWKPLYIFACERKDLKCENALFTFTVNIAKLYRKTNYTIQNNNKLAI